MLPLSQKAYIDKVVEKFGMDKAKHVIIHLAPHFYLSSDLSPKIEEEKDSMHGVPYKSVVGSIMYAMVSKCPNIAHAVGVVSRFMRNVGKPHWEAIRWIL